MHRNCKCNGWNSSVNNRSKEMYIVNAIYQHNWHHPQVTYRNNMYRNCNIEEQEINVPYMENISCVHPHPNYMSKHRIRDKVYTYSLLKTE